MVLENNSLFTEPGTIVDYMDPMVEPWMYAIQHSAPLVKSDNGQISVFRDTYKESDDPLKMLPPEGTPEDWEPDPVQVTLGDLVPMNTQMRKAVMKFKKSDWKKPNAEVFTTKTYKAVSYMIGYQLQSQCVTALQNGANVTTTLFDAKKGDVWSAATADPLKALRALAADFGNVGADLTTVMVHNTNFFELLDHLEVEDYDMTYSREEVAPNRMFDHRTLILRLNVNPQINVVGMRHSFITEGRMIGVGGIDTEPAANTHFYEDPDYNTQKLPEYDWLPLQVNPYTSANGRYNYIEAWIDAKTVVQRQNAVSYEGDDTI